MTHGDSNPGRGLERAESRAFPTRSSSPRPQGAEARDSAERDSQLLDPTGIRTPVAALKGPSPGRSRRGSSSPRPQGAEARDSAERDSQLLDPTGIRTPVAALKGPSPGPARG